MKTIISMPESVANLISPCLFNEYNNMISNKRKKAYTKPSETIYSLVIATPKQTPDACII